MCQGKSDYNQFVGETKTLFFYSFV